MVEEALKLDPKLADACEGMGFLYFQQGKTAEASKWYSEAVALNSQSYSANFYYAANLLRVRLDDDTAAKAESSLRTALKINPDFAPAYSALAYLLAEALRVGHQRPDEAYIAVLHAIELEPGNVYYRIGAVQVFERLGRAEDAVTVANLAVSLARTPQEQAAASATLSSAQQFQAYHNRAEEFRKLQASAESFRLPSVVVSPTSAQVATGAKQQFSASVPGAANAVVNWSVGGSGCAASACRQHFRRRTLYCTLDRPDSSCHLCDGNHSSRTEQDRFSDGKHPAKSVVLRYGHKLKNLRGKGRGELKRLLGCTIETVPHVLSHHNLVNFIDHPCLRLTTFPEGGDGQENGTFCNSHRWSKRV